MPHNTHHNDNNLHSRSSVWREIMSFYNYLKPGILAMRIPLVGPLLARLLIKENSDSNWILPVEAAIPTGERYSLPFELVRELVYSADGIFQMAACPCRNAFSCQHHPITLGCLHLGPASKGIPTEVGSLVSEELALFHIEQAMASGLLPTILYIPSEAEIFQVDRKEMLSICFCCECCCDVRLLLREGPDRYWDVYNQRLPGVRIQVDNTCNLCGDCIEACYGGNKIISLGPERAVIDERCLVCGLCVEACPESAIQLHCDSTAEITRELLSQVRARTKIN